MHLQPIETKAKFSEMGMDSKILQTLNRLKFEHPTPIQEKAIPIGIEGKDIVGIAQTGTGKTLAFAIPIIHQIVNAKIGNRQAIVIVPTRELAIQVGETIQKFALPFDIRGAILIGGVHISGQMQQLRRRPEVIIGTPGRIIDHIEHRTINLKDFNILVLDEADRMFDMGFAPQIKQILEHLPTERQTMLFSATMPSTVTSLVTRYTKNPIRIEVARHGSVADKVKQDLYYVKKDQKIRLLEELLKDFKGSVLVFSRTKFGAQKICKSIQLMGHKAKEIHSNKSLGQRREALAGFKSGRYRILVATDVASRGIDVEEIELVVNFDIPDDAEDYIHRIGRTARAGLEGRAISFATTDQRGKVYQIERLMKIRINVLQHPLAFTPSLGQERPAMHSVSAPAQSAPHPQQHAPRSHHVPTHPQNTSSYPQRSGYGSSRPAQRSGYKKPSFSRSGYGPSRPAQGEQRSAQGSSRPHYGAPRPSQGSAHSGQSSARPGQGSPRPSQGGSPHPRRSFSRPGQSFKRSFKKF
ncbi:MAG: DEAD/DEAH box helicase, ATP-dependent RNA helicase RhlE [Candidatus Peregrinibacteria bacterium GW2011_GWC2_39_14]|nr:MAG: DEAD/DEAH box helicase domain protein [Candidatus Peregrinibacteria bacterium GW2011_GWA2_38_36]KKR06596.1 MAG: DEAD/DEAH box helicase, ATP-dependent RNA helicase RhlE [Candidatus Peregrinibacteria bacterium GW2011_GWC2_39_14]